VSENKTVWLSNIANVLVVIVRSASSPFSAYGVVYAVVGATVGFAFSSTFHSLQALRNGRSHGGWTRKTLGRCFLNLRVPIASCLGTVSSAEFAGVGQDANVVGRILAFLGGLVTSFGYAGVLEPKLGKNEGHGASEAPV